MSSRLTFESWQMLFPAVGFAIFFLIFIGVVLWVCRLRRSAVSHMQNLPLEEEHPHRASRHAAVAPPSRTATTSDLATPLPTHSATTHVR